MFLIHLMYLSNGGVHINFHKYIFLNHILASTLKIWSVMANSLSSSSKVAPQLRPYPPPPSSFGGIFCGTFLELLFSFLFFFLSGQALFFVASLTDFRGVFYFRNTQRNIQFKYEDK